MQTNSFQGLKPFAILFSLMFGAQTDAKSLVPNLHESSFTPSKAWYLILSFVSYIILHKEDSPQIV